MEIVLNGVSITDLKEKRELIKKDAAKFISNGIESVSKLVHEIAKETNYGLAEAKAQEALELLEGVHLVSGVSGVKYCLPYYEEYRDNDPVLSQVLEGERESSSEEEDADHELAYNPYNGVFAKLSGLLEEMESDSYGWFSSSAHC